MTRRQGGAMRTIRFLHRWAGGLIGLLLAVIGASGTLLMHQDAWLRATLPHAADALVQQDSARLAPIVTRLFADPVNRPSSILFAREGFGLDRLSYTDRDAGAYVDQAGNIVTRWSSKWERPEVWLFDLHHHLLAGPAGDIVAGIAGLVGIGFVVTGGLLWWRTRRTFAFRLWPRRLSRAAILRHHRDLGIVAAPLLLLSFVTGAMMNLPPVERLLLRPFSAPAEIAPVQARPKGMSGSLVTPVDWRGILDTAHARFPDAELRWIGLPAEPGGPIKVRMRQPSEWTPNGLTILWFDPASSRLAGVQDALTLPKGAQIAALEYPVHAGKVGGLAWRLVMTLSGLALTILGTMAVYAFWLGRGSPNFSRR